MRYLLDTNICVHFFRGKYNLIERLSEVGLNHCAISEITLAELFFGAEYSSDPEKNLKTINTFIRRLTIIPILDTLHLYGKEKARLRKMGKMISDFDLMIGCTSVSNDLIMVTENVSEFSRIAGIQIENWVSRSS